MDEDPQKRHDFVQIASVEIAQALVRSNINSSLTLVPDAAVAMAYKMWDGIQSQEAKRHEKYITDLAEGAST